MEIQTLAAPGTVVPVGVQVAPAGRQGAVGPPGPNAVSANAGNQATLGTDNLIYVPDPTPIITSVRLRSFNAIGNPNFEVRQRNAGAAVTTSGASVEDRWTNWITGPAGSWGIYGAGNTVPGTNFYISNGSMRFTLTTPKATLAATDIVGLFQNVEGPLLRELIGDVHSVSILAQSSVANITFGLSIRNTAATYSLVKLCTLAAANTPTLIKLPALPLWVSGGAWTTAPGQIGYVISVCLGAGSTYIAPANDTWQSGNFVGAVGQSNFAASAANSTFDLIFLQHEPGTNCSQLMDLDFQTNLERSKRYFQKSLPYANAPGAAVQAGMVYQWTQNGQNPLNSVFYRPTMAKSPTVTIYSPYTANASGKCNNVGTGDLTASVYGTPAGETGFSGIVVTGMPAAAWQCAYHYTADTGL